MSTQQYPFLPQMLSPTSYAMGRPLTTTHKIGNGVQRTISSKSYDELGRLSADNRNGLASLKETRSYNLRSWLTNIDGQMFTEALKYENSTIPQWGGNISVMQWGESAVQNAYSFIYDTHSRLQTANYSNSSSAGLYSEIYNYDLNGNMLRHVRGSQPLVMSYSGNRLMSAGNAAFEYDSKGRQVMSSYGSGLSTVYNLLDLPQRQTTGEGTVVDYKYAFDGRKLQEKVTAGTSVTQRDYSGEFLYEGGVLKKILFDGGYVMNGESGPVYMFFLRDHLGSVRAVVSETGVVQQRNNYFPYGDLFPNTSIDSSANRYRYTGKESGDEIGLYDFSARFLHTRFGRFTTIDPLAEKYPGISPYAYCNGNPVNFVDPDGQVPIFVVTALIGAGVSGIAAVMEGKSASEILAATVGGAVDGFIGGIPVGKVMSAIKSIGLGTLGSGLGDLVELSINRAFDNQDEIDWNGFLLNFAIGGVTNTGTELTVKGIKQLGDLAINSDAAIKQLEEMLKRDAKSQGRKYTNKELSRKVNNRTKEKLHANEKLEDFNSIVLDNIIDFNNEIYGDDR